MKVWVLVQGCYSDQWVQGVYASPEAAIAANPVPDPLPPHVRAFRVGGWKEGSDGWDNGLDWGDAQSLQPFDVEGLPESATKRILERMQSETTGL